MSPQYTQCPNCGSTVGILGTFEADRDEWKTRAEKAERERDGLVGILNRHAPEAFDEWVAALAAGEER